MSMKLFKEILAQQKLLAQQVIEICNKYEAMEDISKEEQESVLVNLCSSLLCPEILDMELWKKPELSEIFSSIEDVVKSQAKVSNEVPDAELSDNSGKTVKESESNKSGVIIGNVAEVVDTDIETPVNMPHINVNSYRAEVNATQIKERAQLLRKIL